MKKSLGNSQYIAQIAGIGTGLSIPIIILLLLIFLFIIFTRKSKQDEYETYERGE